MRKLENLFSNAPSLSNPLCEGCSILKKSKPCHSVMDYETLGQADVLFLSDSVKFKHGKALSFDGLEKKIIGEFYDGEAAFAASVKCPSVREADMSPSNMEICRQHLEATIDRVKPKLVFVCGNLAMKMLVKKSGITNKRGKIYSFSTEAGHHTHVSPIYHPYSVSKEPRHRYLFERDIRNAYDRYILEKKGEGKVEYRVLRELDEINDVRDRLAVTTDTISCDIETTGLNFLQDKIMTIAISSKEGTWVIPIDHEDSPFKDASSLRPSVLESLQQILGNPNNKKVFHNAKFDLKFLLKEGITVTNVWDTKIMHHLLDENIPKGLKDLVKLYFPTHLEEF